MTIFMLPTPWVEHSSGELPATEGATPFTEYVPYIAEY